MKLLDCARRGKDVRLAAPVQSYRSAEGEARQMPGEPRKGQSNLGRFYGIGIEFAAAVAGLTLLGYWIDRHFGTDPKGLLICAGLGLVGGMYNLIRSSLLASKEEAGSEARKPDGDPGP